MNHYRLTRGQNPLGIEELVPLASIHFRQAFKKQNLAGWRYFMSGRFSLLWAHFINFEIEMGQKEGQKK